MPPPITGGRLDFKRTLAAGLAQIEGPLRSIALFEHGTLTVKLYAPRECDPQTPHSRDEIYIVMQGSGEFVIGAERAPFAPGDVLFVPAGMTHRFEEFSADVALWVIFYGPVGGEQPVE